MHFAWQANETSFSYKETKRDWRATHYAQCRNVLSDVRSIEVSNYRISDSELGERNRSAECSGTLTSNTLRVWVPSMLSPSRFPPSAKVDFLDEP